MEPSDEHVDEDLKKVPGLSATNAVEPLFYTSIKRCPMITLKVIVIALSFSLSLYAEASKVSLLTRKPFSLRHYPSHPPGIKAFPPPLSHGPPSVAVSTTVFWYNSLRHLSLESFRVFER